MDHFCYQNGKLFAEGVAIEEIAKQVGTPFYCYSTATISRHYTVFRDAFKDNKVKICYAIKANSNLAVIKTVAELGGGADTVSEGEIRRARAAGVPADKIVFSGVGKTKEEMAYALKEGIFQFNVESEPELVALNEVAMSLGKKAPIAFRVNPNVDSKTHKKIATGGKGDKFGVDWTEARDIYNKASEMEGIEIKAIATHIGSQLVDLMPFQEAFKRVEDLVLLLRADGHNIERLDLGGGLGIPYSAEKPPSPDSYAQMTLDATKHLGCELVFEPGRLIMGNAGILVSKVIYVKRTNEKVFTIIDAAMNDLIRPSFYDAYHEMVPVVEHADDEAKEKVDIVGPVCETGDIFAKDRAMPILEADDLIAIRSSGAYAAVMASNYNSRLMIPEIMVNGDQFAVIRERETYDELMAKDKLPEWF